MGSIFVSYRREDSAGYAGRLAEHLSSEFGAAHVFLDVQDITPGQDFAEAIEKTIAACEAVVVVIGPRWVADLMERKGGEDFVLHEISVALRRKITVIPVLVGGAKMPSASDLPENIAILSRRQALEISDSRFQDDAKLLASTLRKIPGFGAAPGGSRRLRTKKPETDITGTWIAEMQKAQQPPFRVRLDLASSARELTGTVAYPTGEGSIQAGTRERDRLAFVTVHVPQFADAPATIRWTGTIEGDQIRFTVTTDSGVATGVARRG